MPITNQEELDNAASLLNLFTATLIGLIDAVAQGSKQEANKAASDLIAQHSEAIKQ